MKLLPEAPDALLQLGWGDRGSDGGRRGAIAPPPSLGILFHGLNLTLGFSLRTPPPQSLYCISWKKPKSPQGTGGGSGLRRTSQAKGGGRPGNPWPLTLDPAAPAFPRGGRISLWGMWRSLSFLRGTSASLGEGLGFGWSPQELRSPLRVPRLLPSISRGPPAQL